LGLAVVRDLREPPAPSTEDELADFETDVLAGFVLVRTSCCPALKMTMLPSLSMQTCIHAMVVAVTW